MVLGLPHVRPQTSEDTPRRSSIIMKNLGETGVAIYKEQANMHTYIRTFFFV
jgi:hypothetical protein